MAASVSGRQPASSTAAAVGTKIRLRRRQRGMSAAEMARRAGLSKATLSQLEAGRGNPTIDTLDAIAIALSIPLADLLAREADTGPVYRPGTVAEPGEVSRELLRRISSGNSLEIWRLRVPPETELAGVPHATGTTEHLLVSTGHMTAGPVDAPQDLGPGDMLAFAGDAPHFYRTDTEPADITVVLASPINT
ncbi:helix-turn-helix domain-containing protein [Streptomyces sp. NPDC021225]|uniref:helix-turn-helix domain-containing protein n=1 Tax=Streptomyces sp. NPDC021225 TaxID=3365121 RepID=UPI0037B4F6B3